MRLRVKNIEVYPAFTLLDTQRSPLVLFQQSPFRYVFEDFFRESDLPVFVVLVCELLGVAKSLGEVNHFNRRSASKQVFSSESLDSLIRLSDFGQMREILPARGLEHRNTEMMKMDRCISCRICIFHCGKGAGVPDLSDRNDTRMIRKNLDRWDESQIYHIL